MRGDSAGEKRLTAGLVYHAESRVVGRGVTALRRKCADLSAGRLPPVAPYQGKPGFFRLGALAETLEQLGRAGLRDVYEGDVAQATIADVKDMGGVLSAEDLPSCWARVSPAPQHHYTLQLAGGLTAAPTMVRVLEQMARVRIGAAPDADWYRAFTRAMKTAYAERFAGLGDAGPMDPDTCTSHLTVCDQDGTMVAMTTTLLSSMGSRVVLPRSGILMNNGVMWFDPRPNQPNSIGGGKRPLTNMCPVILREADRPWFAAGGSGGRRILAAVTQMMAFVTDFGMSLEQNRRRIILGSMSPIQVMYRRTCGLVGRSSMRWDRTAV